ncbi:MAG: sigma-70 family RNA polymerase sigma factor [Planctomycetia bacterium]|nr:sigma-70 family RNA polymerase sigma factor [Planctomycetia bacterium]
MRAPERPPSDSDELYRLFQQLFRTTSQNARSGLIRQIIVRLRRKLEAACGVAMKHYAHRNDLRNDVLQTASLLLTERLTVGNLAYQDEGPDRFLGWLYRVCRSATADGWRLCRPDRRESTFPADAQQLARVAAPPQPDRRQDRLVRAVDAIPDPYLRLLMLEMLSGVAADDSARHRGISPSTIYRMRRAGLAWLRRYFDDEPGDFE